jgi:hypothetical protein
LEKEEFLQQIDDICNLKVKAVQHGRNTKIVMQPDQVVYFRPGGGRSMAVSQEGLESLEKFTTIPHAFEKKLDNRTYNMVANELLQKKDQYSVITKDNVVTGFAPLQDFRYIDPEKVAVALYKAVPGGQIDRVMQPAAYTAAVDIYGEKETPVQVGDLVRAGATLVFSPINAQAPVVTSYAWRLTCRNGAQTQDIFQKFEFGGGGGRGGDSGGNSGNFWSWLHKSIKTAYGSIDLIVARWRLMLNDEIPEGQRAAMLTALLNKARISGEVADAVRAEALENPPRTAYDLMQLVTWASSHVIEEPKRVVYARKAADDFSREHTHEGICPLCHNSTTTPPALPPPAEVAA